MIDTLQNVIEQMGQLDPALQELFAERIKQMLLELDADSRTQEAIARQDAEWRARLPEQLARIARGEHGTICHNEEELDTALDAIPLRTYSETILGARKIQPPNRVSE